MHVFYRNVKYEQIHAFAMKFSLNNFVKMGKVYVHTYIRSLYIYSHVARYLRLCKKITPRKSCILALERSLLMC